MDSLKVLTLGNSFTDSLAAFFPQAASSAGCELHFERANHGGCELSRHWEYISNEERDACYAMYQDRRWKFREILAREPWDVVTIQQASHASWDPETYFPFAQNIAELIRRYAPRAEIVVQQTWAYRADDPRIMPGGAWGFDQSEMYERLTANYRRLARELGNLRIIPTGLAVQLSRCAETAPFINYPPELLTALRWPDLPAQAGDVVGAMGWYKNKETGELFIGRDTIHLNARGQYLQAAVWFGVLFGRPPRDISYVPEVLADADAAFLRIIAQKALDQGVH